MEEERGEKKMNRRKARRQGLTGGLQLGPHVSKTGPPWNGLRVVFRMVLIPKGCVLDGFEVTG